MFNQLDVFVVAARWRSLRRTADELSITEPTASWRLHSLERALGVTLFIRSRRGLELTDVGRAMLPYAERAVRASQDVAQAAANLRAGLSGRLEIGSAPSVSTYLLPDILKRFRAEHPGVDVAVRTGHSEEVLQAVLDGEVQVGLVRDVHWQRPGISSVMVYEDEIVLAAHPDHQFARLGSVSVEELGREGIILFDRTSSFWEMTQSLFATAGVEPRVTMELDSVESAKMMVLHGLGVALLPYMALRDDMGTGALRRVQVTAAPRIFRHILAIRRGDRPLGHLQAALLALFSNGGG